jgi:hypothetical protein
MMIQITKLEIEALIQRRLQSGEFRDSVRSSQAAPRASEAERAAAIERLNIFGKTHRLSLGGMTIRELRDEVPTEN